MGLFFSLERTVEVGATVTVTLGDIVAGTVVDTVIGHSVSVGDDAVDDGH